MWKSRNAGIVISHLNDLETADPELRLRTLKIVFYIAFGLHNTQPTRQAHLSAIAANSALLFQNSTLNLAYNILKHSSASLDYLATTPLATPEETTLAAEAATLETGLALDLIYLMLECAIRSEISITDELSK